MGDAVGAVFLEGAENNLRIRLGTKAMPLSFQAGTQITVVVNLAIENNDQTCVLVVDGLVAGSDVDNGQTASAEKSVRILVVPGMVGATVPQAHSHGLRKVRGKWASVRSYETENSAHGPLFSA